MNTALELAARMIRPVATSIAVAATLVACGGNTTGSGDGSDPGLQTGDGCAVGAIEGGGRQKLSGPVTSVGADGRVTVSNVRFDATGAQAFVDGSFASVADIRAGDVVTVNGAVDLETRSGCAATIHSDADITATVDSVDLAGQSLRVLGQEVRVDDATMFADDTQGRGLASLQPGDRVRVTGLYGRGIITATRIDPAPDGQGYFVAGVVTALDAPSHRLLINGIIVQYDNSTLEGFETGGPRARDVVRVTGSLFETFDAPPQGYTIVYPERIERTQQGTPLAISPTSAAVYDGDTIQFSASTGADTVTWSIAAVNGTSCVPTSCGSIDGSGQYSAPATSRAMSVLVTATSITDPRNTATATVVLRSLQPPADRYTLSGEVFAIDSGALADVPINIWIGLPGWGYSYWWAHGPLHSNALGLFEAPYLPNSAHISIDARKAGYFQPCAVTMRITEDSTVRIELVSASTLDAFDPPRPQLATEPTLSGNIFETTATGRQPVPGAMLWVASELDEVFATTLSDRGGNYFVCNLDDLPDTAYLAVTKPGFTTRWVGPVNSGQSAMLDVELQRE